jgi:hypothetical protein
MSIWSVTGGSEKRLIGSVGRRPNELGPDGAGPFDLNPTGAENRLRTAELLSSESIASPTARSRWGYSAANATRSSLLSSKPQRRAASEICADDFRTTMFRSGRASAPSQATKASTIIVARTEHLQRLISHRLSPWCRGRIWSPLNWLRRWVGSRAARRPWRPRFWCQSYR